MKKMFSILITVLVLFSFNSFAQHSDGHSHSSHDHEIKWLHNLEDAMAESKKSGKPIFVDFTGSDWCGWCIKLDKEVFSKDSFKDYASHNLIMVELDFPRKKQQSDDVKKYNENLLRKYGVRGFPTILLLNPEGKVIGQTGYQAGGPANYVKHLKDMLAKK